MEDLSSRARKEQGGGAEVWLQDGRRSGDSLLSSLGRSLSRTAQWLLKRNRRRFDRHPCEFPVELHFDEQGAVRVMAATARNISNHGMLLQCAQLPKQGTLCLLEFGFPQWSAPGDSESRPVSIRAEIRHREPGQSTFGVAFAMPLGLALNRAA